MTEERHHQRAEVLDLREYLVVLRRRRWTVIITFVGLLASALLVSSRQTPIYQASTRLLLENVSASVDQIIQAAVFDVDTQRELVRSTTVAVMVADDLGFEGDPQSLLGKISVQSPSQARVLTITARDTDPARAAALAQGFATSYLDFRRADALERLLAAEKDLLSRTEGIRTRLEALGPAVAPEAATDEDSAIAIERQSLITQLGQISAQLALVDARDDFFSGGGQIIEPARVPGTPVEPRPLRTGIFAGILGLMLGLGLAFLRDFLDDSVKSEHEITRATGRPILGHVPRYEPGLKGDLKPVSMAAPTHAAAEGFRTLRTNLHFLSLDQPIKTLLVTSAEVGEGKTTTATNLAVTAALAGRRVVLIDADLRRPTVHRAFGIENEVGLTDVLIGQASLDDAIRTVGSVKILTAGKLPPNPAELLSSGRMSDLIASLQQRSNASLIIFDGAPVLAVADALSLAPQMSATMMVARFGLTSRHRLRAAAARLGNVGASLVGTVLNEIDPNDAGYYHYYYADQYYEYVPEARPDGNGNGATKRRKRPLVVPMDVPQSTVSGEETDDETVIDPEPPKPLGDRPVVAIPESPASEARVQDPKPTLGGDLLDSPVETDVDPDRGPS